jgi:RND family efflux transporter MFP subunit
MNEENDNQPKPQSGDIQTEPSRVHERRSSRTAVVGIVAVVAIVGIGFIAWLLWPKQSGKPVPAPRTVSFEESPRPSTPVDERLTLTPEQARAVQLKIETIGEAPSNEAAGQMATGVVQANSYKETPVISLVGGIVRAVNSQLGQNVKRGQLVAVVFSNDLSEAQSKYLAALATLDEHHRHHMRTMKLVEIGAASRQDLEMAASQYREAETNLANLRQKLILLGMTAQRIDALNSTSQISSEVSVTAPANGTVTNRSVNPGEVIEANKELLRVTDLSTVWVVGQVYEKDLATVRVGSGANITSEAYPNRVFRGRVSYVDPKIDPATRTAQVRIELANPGQMFKIGMYVNLAFGALGAAEKTMPVVPKDAVQTIGNQQFVFLATDKTTEFILRPVRLGAESNGLYPVLEGLRSGDRIVSEGSFLLRAEWVKLHPAQTY